MAKYARYNPAITSPSPVIGWYDTDSLTYASLPTLSNLVVLTSEQWESHFVNPSGYAINNGALIDYAPPAQALTLSQQAQAALAIGLDIKSTGSPVLNGIYAISTMAQQNIIATQLYVTVNGKFPGSSGTMSWVQANGYVVSFQSTAEFQAFASAVASYVADLQEIALTNSGVLPAASVTIP